ncbi:MAG: hypothetical protein U0637_10560 [Phycisphaerales bacterium]
MRNMCNAAAALTILLLAGVAPLTGCHAVGEKDEAVCLKPKPGTITSVNEYCAVNLNDPVDPTLTAQWKGQTVGFCCKGCLPKWANMTDAEKDAAVAKAVAKGKIKG